MWPWKWKVAFKSIQKRGVILSEPSANFFIQSNANSCFHKPWTTWSWADPPLLNWNLRWRNFHIPWPVEWFWQSMPVPSGSALAQMSADPTWIERVRSTSLWSSHWSFWTRLTFRRKSSQPVGPRLSFVTHTRWRIRAIQSNSCWMASVALQIFCPCSCRLGQEEKERHSRVNKRFAYGMIDVIYCPCHSSDGCDA